MLYNIDPNIVKSVITVESNWQSNNIGQAGEIGLMQIMPGNSFLSQEELSKPENNLKEGIKLLKFAKDNCPFQEDFQWVICYNRGVFGGSKVKNPNTNPYYLKVKKEYEKTKSSREKIQ